MYRIIVPDAFVFQRFLSVVETEWVVIAATKDGTLLMENTSELFAVLQLQSQRAVSDRDLLFRIKRDLLKLLVVTGTIEIDNATDNIKLTFIGGNNVRRIITIPKHQAFITAYKEKFNILSSASGKAFDAKNLYNIYSISKTLRSYTEVENGIAGVVARDGTRVYKKVAGIPDICLTTQALNALFSCDDVWYHEKNFVYAARDSFGVLVTQCRGSGLLEYNSLCNESGGSAIVTQIDFTDVFAVVLKVKCEEIVLDVRSNKCNFSAGDVFYQLPLVQQNVKVAEKHNGIVHLNTRVVINILTKLPDKVITLRVKKYFIEMTCGNLTVVCK